MLYRGKGGKQYNLEQTPFAGGGEGKIYNIIGHPSLVAKLYKANHNTIEKEKKLVVMVDNPPDQAIMTQISWPLDVLYDNNHTFVGFIMPKLQINEELNVIYETGSSSKYPDTPWRNKIVIAKNLCVVLNAVHSVGHVVGDLNPKNISVDPSTGHIVFVDTDSYHIEDNGHTYRCDVGMPEYLPVEIQRKMKNGLGLSSAPLPTFTRESDNFALALHIFQLLMNGTHPFACRVLPSNKSVAFPQPTDNILNGVFPFMQPASGIDIPVYAPPIDILPVELQELFERAFISGCSNPAQRPNAEEWYLALCKLENEITKCKRVAHHEYYNGVSKCPWCEIDRNINGGVYPSSIPMVQVTIQQGLGAGYKNTKPHNNHPNPSPKVASPRKRNALILTISLLCLALLIGGITGGQYYKKGMDEVNQSIRMIDALPNHNSITDFDAYENDIINAYASYNSLSDWQKNKVTNSDRVLKLIPKLNEYKVNALRSEISLINAETVSSTDCLQKTVELYNSASEEQKAMLSSEEIAQIENYLKVKQVIDELDAIEDDLINKYNTIDTVRQIYLSIDEPYRELVYNYGLIETFDSQHAFLQKFIFSVVDNGYSIKVADNVKLEGNIEIPSRYNNKDVVKIASNAFLDQRDITSIVVPQTVTKIDSGAFSGCNRLESITLPFVGSTMSSGTFSYVFGSASVPQSLKKVTITAQDKVVDSAFSGCNHIEQINYEKELDYIGANSFNGCEKLSTFNSTEIGTINLLGRMDKIGSSAFKNCETITNVIFSDDIITIENYAFSGCKNITELNFTNRLIKIGDYAFQGLSKLNNITVPDNVETIGAGVFKDCSRLEKISIPFTGQSKNSEDYKAVFGWIFGYVSDGYWAIAWKSGFLNEAWSLADLDDAPKTRNDGGIWQYTLADKTDRTSYWYYIPSSLRTVIVTNQTEIKTATFNGCSMLTNVIYTKGIEKQGEYAFQKCEATISNFMPSISFDANGGGDIQTITDIPGNTIELPTPIKENYVFVEWQTSNGNVFNSTSMPNANITLKAKWLPMIIFDAGEIATVESIIQEPNTAIELPQLSREGYFFSGWYKGEENVTLDTMPKESIVLRAGWQKIINISKTVYNGGNSVYKFSGISSPNISSPLCFEIDYRSLVPDNVNAETVTFTFSVDMKAGIKINEIRAHCYNSKTFSNDTLVFGKSFTEFTTSYYTYTFEQEMSKNGIIYLCFYTPNGYNNNNSDNVMCIRKLTYTISYIDNDVIFD